MNDPDNNFSSDKLQQIDSPYFSVETVKTISEQLNGKNFYILHLNIRSRAKSIDNFREFLVSLKGSFNTIDLTESWCDETANNSLLNLKNNYSVHQTRQNKKRRNLRMYSQKPRIQNKERRH